VVWEFDGFFKGHDRWECFAESNGTRLVNRFEFQIPNPLVAFGFKTFASGLTRQDMQAQLVRLKKVAEAIAIIK
jgi:Polyketide cyclase / dehydrase and lipid transport